MMIPDDMTQTTTTMPATGYVVLKPFLRTQQREVDRILGDGNCFSGLCQKPPLE